jgi:hypothetical protein
MEIEKTDKTPEEETFDNTEDLFEKLNSDWMTYQKKHPISTWINNKFPNGLYDYSVTYILTHPWEILHQWKYEIKYAYQRVFRGWDDRAMWGVDMYIAKMIPGMMRQLKEWKQGLPNNVFEGLPYEDENNYSYSEESMIIASERWDKILDEIAEGFEIYYLNSGDMIYYKDEENLKKTEKYKKAFDLLRENFGSLGD